MKVLSVCIPAYNRSAQLEELVKSLLEVKSDDFDVVVTNNCSTDNTLEMLGSIDDDRLIVHTNTQPEPALYNMIVSVFNATGKYALYCNDRDLICTERMIPFIDFLKKHDYSYLHIPKNHGEPSYNLIELEKGFNSLVHHSYSEHPTGMVFNAELMRKHLSKENYRCYVEYFFTFCFLSRDLFCYEKSAEYDICLWNTRPSIYKVKSASGTIYKGQLFFDTESIIRCMVAVVNHIIENPVFNLSVEQQKKLILNIFNKHHKNLVLVKEYYEDIRECAHYGIKPRYVSYFEIRKAHKRYIDECDEVLKIRFDSVGLREKWDAQKKTLLKSLYFDCIKCDMSIVKRTIKRVLNPRYRY